MKGVLSLLIVGTVSAAPFNPYTAFNKFQARSESYSMYDSPFVMPYNSHHSPKHSKYFLNSQKKPLSYAYMANPMASVELTQPKPVTYSHHSSSPFSTFQQKMVGEQFFKHPEGHAENEPIGDEQELPYTLVQDYGPYELREYPEMKFACVQSEVDNAEDPLAGLKNMNPFIMMSSKRWKKTPQSVMFMQLFKYISGVNKEGQEVEMTRPVSTHHAVKEQREGGDLEVQEMCFYIPQEHQANPPQPLDTSPVYIHTRPNMRVYVRRFGGYLMAAEEWSEQRELLETLLFGKAHNQNEYYTNGYNSPMELFNRRNEVWVEDVTFEKSADNFVAAVGGESAEPEAEPEHSPEEDLGVQFEVEQ
eukprot:TRINITY_DN10879_c0_g1_i1.p1 TRINITY_DN10879_c0_g1~~TRINITY_DN10879_c0_g1_i1.p1  ORF type:complete len:361 (+),score=116.59 TRINITY_DN10879_c0_g1_i1:36-1118(+)